MKQRILSIFLSAALLVGLLVVPGVVASADTITWQNGDVGKYAVLDAAPTDTPVNKVAPQNGTTGANMSRNQGGAAWACLMDGSLTSGTVQYYTTTPKAWYQFTFALGSTVTVDRLFVASLNAETRQVSVKFYASTDLATLYDDSNLIAAKDGLGADELNVLLKGTAKAASYVGFATYYPDTATESGIYPGIGARASQTHLLELAVYAAAEGEEEEPESTPVGSYEVLDAVPTDTPLNGVIKPTIGTTSTEYNHAGGTMSYLTDGNLDNVKKFYQSDTTKTGYWEYFTFNLGSVKKVDRLFVASEEASTRQVYVKFYASTDVANLYDDANLMAETKDGLGATELNVLLKGEAKDAQYVGMMTYVVNTATDTQYTGIGPRGYQIRFREIAFYEAAEEEEPSTPEEAPVALGAQVRDTDAAGNTALRFGFDLTATGVKYANEDPEAANDYTRDLSAATVTVDGQAYTLVDFGAVLSLNAEDALTLESAAANENGTTSKVSAVNLYSVTDTTVRYTAVVTNIPAAHLGTAIYTRSYVTYNDGTKDVTVYGQTISRTVNGVTSGDLS